MIFFRQLKKHIQQNTAISLLLFFGVVVCVYCISVMLGVAVGEYELELSSNTYASITLDVNDVSDLDLDEISEKIKQCSEKGVINILYMTRMADDCVLIGWDGVEGQNWFPLTGGRFFDEEEMEMESYVAFVSDNTNEAVLSEHVITVGENAYDIIGTGWLVPWNFQTAVSEKSKVRVIREEDTEFNLSFVLIPFLRYKENFEPEQILVQFRSANYADLKKYAKKMEQEISGANAYPPDRNSDGLYFENQVRYGKMAVVLCLISGLTVLRVMAQWLKLYRKDLYVLRICGMSKRKCFLHVYGHWFFYYIIGGALAVFLHIRTFPLLKAVYGDSVPSAVTMGLVLAVMFGLSVLATVPEVNEIIDMQDMSKGKGAVA